MSIDFEGANRILVGCIQSIHTGKEEDNNSKNSVQ